MGPRRPAGFRGALGTTGLALLLVGGLALGGEPLVSLIDASLNGVILENAPPPNKDREDPPDVIAKFVDEEEALRLERDLSEAWNRYDARTFYRMLASVRGQSQCRQVQDSYLKAWQGTKVGSELKELNSNDFCDGLSYATPAATCDETLQRLAQARSYAQSKYYADYWNDVRKAIQKRAPQGVSWERWDTPGGGGYFIPISSKTRDRENPLYEAVGSRVYLEQALSPKKYGGEGGSKDPPGIPNLEEAKRKATDRGGIHASPNYWAGISGGPEPKGKFYTSTPERMEVHGAVTFLVIYTRIISETSPRKSAHTCLETKFTIPMLVTIPITLTHNTRAVDTAWYTVPEGYPVPMAKGTPRVGP